MPCCLKYVCVMEGVPVVVEGGERLEAMLFSQRPCNSPPFPLRHAARITARRREVCVTSQGEKEDQSERYIRDHARNLLTYPVEVT
jgi:hypothetical protein